MIKRVMLFLALLLPAYAGHAGWLDEISTIVGGHISDLQSRFTDDQLIDGDIIARASFREDDRGQDSLHHGSGSVLIVNTPEGRFLQLAPDFTSTPGPDYHVYVSQDVNIDHEDRFIKARQAELGRLAKGSGQATTGYPKASSSSRSPFGARLSTNSS